MLHRIVPSSVAALWALSAASCSHPQGRIMEDSEQDYVGARAAGAETYDRLIAESVRKLLESHTAANAGTSKLQIAVLPVENKSSEELGDWQDQIYQLISTSINQSGRYDSLSERFVNAALREARLRPDELFVPAKQRQFLAVLETDDNPVQLLLFPTVTSGTTVSEDVRQRNYMLTLQLVDTKSGKAPQQVGTQIRKAYTR